jgi:hypothetical protein
VNALYPLTNIDDDQPWNPVQFTVNPTYLLLDKGSATRTDIVSFIHANFDAGTVLRVQENATNVWTSPTISHQFTADGPAEDDMPSNPLSDRTAVSGFTIGGLRYLRILIVSGQTSLLSIGNIRVSGRKRVFSDTTTTVRDRSYGAIDRELHPVIKRKTDAGTSVGYSRGTRSRDVAGTIRCDADGYADLLTMTRSSRGASRPFLLVPNPDVNEALFVNWDDSTPLERAYTDLGINDVRVLWSELGRGLVP